MSHTQPTTKVHSRLVTAPIQVFVGVLALAVLSQVAVPIPFSPAPLSLGTLAAMSLGVFLTPGRAIMAATLYAIAGALGAPIFAGMSSGVMIASFGYVIGYIAAAAVVSYYAKHAAKIRPLVALLVTGTASLLILIFGSVWLALAVGLSLPAAITAGMVPFLIGDAIKSIVASAMLVGHRRHGQAW